MVEDWLALIGNMNSAVRDLRQAAPEALKAAVPVMPVLKLTPRLLSLR